MTSDPSPTFAQLLRQELQDTPELLLTTLDLTPDVQTRCKQVQRSLQHTLRAMPSIFCAAW
jgi:hypothetical protein